MEKCIRCNGDLESDQKVPPSKLTLKDGIVRVCQNCADEYYARNLKNQTVVEFLAQS